MTPANPIILLIGHDLDTDKALTNLLEARDYKIQRVQTGEDAMNALETQSFGAAILDLGPSETDALAFLTTLAKANSMLPIILLRESAEIGMERINELMNQGAFGIVPKLRVEFEKGLLLVVSEAMRRRTKPITRPYSKPPDVET